MKRIISILLAALGGLATALLLSPAGDPAASAQPAALRASGPGVETLVWSVKIDLEGASELAYRLPRVPSGNYLATLSAVVSGPPGSDFGCLLTEGDHWLVGDRAPDVGGYFSVQASRKVRIDRATTLQLGCYGSQPEVWKSVRGNALQVSLTRIQRVEKRTPVVIPPKA
jgi:hypothetical protein